MLKFLVLLFFAILAVSSSQRKCLKGADHKYEPTQEDSLQECTLYAKSSCCHADITKELAHSPVIKVKTTYWNRCNSLSKDCERYMKKMECFYRCSPHAAYWAHPNRKAAIKSVPVCKSFCDDWYEACKNDLTCVRNWLTDWRIDDQGENHCKRKCIPYNKTYTDGTDMCNSMWGESLKVSKSTCCCLKMDETDTKSINAIQEMERSSSSSSSSSSSDSSSSSSSDSSSSSSSSDSSSEEKAGGRHMEASIRSDEERRVPRSWGQALL